MAIAGLHNVPVLDPSILRESQSSSSGRPGNQGRISTRASAILQMWRIIEDERPVNQAHEGGTSSLHLESSYGTSDGPEGDGRGGLEDLSESENGSVNNSYGHLGHVNDNEDHQSMTSEQSQDFGEVERERVRKIFREWMNSGVAFQTPNVPQMNRSSRAQWLGETERERVRIVREWIQMTSQQGEACVGNREEQVAEIGLRLERVHDGQVLDHNETQAENSRREIRRLCGRQALLDLLAKKEQERRQELQGLEATRPVSSFAHRNRFQSFIRLRAFQNMRSAEFSRSSSAAESELGLLRQRQTVSGLREGFLSRLDNSVHVQACILSDGPSGNNTDAFRDDEQMRASREIEINASAHEQEDLSGDDNLSSPADLLQLSGCCVGESGSHGLVARTEARLDHVVNNAIDSQQETTSTSNSNDTYDGDPPLNSNEPSRSESGRFSDLEQSHGMFHQLDDVERDVSEYVNGQESHEMLQEQFGTDREEMDFSNQADDVERDVSEYVNGQESHEMLQEQFGTDREEMDFSNQADDVEGDVSEHVSGQESNLQVEAWNMEYDDREWGVSILSNQWIHDDQIESSRQHWLGDGEESSQGALENGAGVQSDAQEDYWHENGSQETPSDWLGMPSGPRASSGRVDTLYFSDDDNVYNMELRELLNRRTVSSLLHSGFRQSLDQLIQSYVERQTQAPDDWEVHEISPPFAAHNHELLNTDLSEESSAAVRGQIMPPIPPPVPQAHWRRLLHHANRSRHEVCQRPGAELETINDLRIDMARLQQRLKNMQRILEACMDMQLELQRSVRQEVSAAWNRSINPSEPVENILPKDSSKWDNVRKGICCVCSNSNINSLLYRCGHMCTCTECATILVEGNGKCPMCQAPVIEVIRAYFIH